MQFAKGEGVQQQPRQVAENASFDPAGCFQNYGEIVRHAPSEADQEALIVAAKAEIKDKKANAKLTRAHKSKIAEDLLKETPDFAARLGDVLSRRPGGFPTVEIEYRNVTVEADALVGAGNNPTVWNSVKSAFLKCLLQGGLKTKPIKILDGVSGVIKPGRLTLVLGPPGAGKSVFMQVLSGRLRAHKALRLGGSVKYNGEETTDFVVQRTAGFVDQYDCHLPNLTVLETVQFAAKCQNSVEEQAKALAAVNALATETEQAHSAGLAVDDLVRYGSAVSAIGSAAEGNDIIYEDDDEDGNGNNAENGGRGDTDIESNSRAAEATATTATAPPRPASAASSFGSINKEGPDHGKIAAQTELEFLELFREAIVFRIKPYIVLQLFGLAHVANTFVGNAVFRGVSGGERKRVTCSEIVAGPQWAFFMDEISTGLDSATTFSVIKSTKETSHALKRTCVISLLQPAPEVMDLFDDLLLITDGKVIYHGPLQEAIPFFSSLGFDCPARKDPASFLQEVTTPLGQLTYASKALLDLAKVPEFLRDPARMLSRPPKKLIVSIDAIADAFWETTHGKEMRRQLDEVPFDPAKGNEKALSRSHYAQSGWNLSMLAFKRQLLLAKRDKAYYIVRVIQAVIMGLIIASFFRTVAPGSDPQDYFNQGRKVLSLCVISTIYLSMSSMPQITFVFEAKNVFFKQRDNHFFPPLAYALCHLFTQLLPSTAESLLFSCVIYFLAGLTPTASNFFIYFLVTWSSSNCFAGLFRLIAYLAPSMVVANALGSLMLLLLMLTNGFTIVRTSIPDYLIWIYWAFNPLAYSVRALAVNELTTARWGATGPQLLESFGFFTDTVWVWIGVGYLWGFLLVITCVGAIILKISNPPTPSPTVAEEDQKKQVDREITNYITRKLVALHLKMKSFKGVAATEGTSTPEGLTPPTSNSPNSMSFTSQASSAPPLAKIEPNLAETLKADFNLCAENDAKGNDASNNQQQPQQQEEEHIDVASVVVPFTPITLVCRNLCYYVNDPSSGAAPGVVKETEDKEIAGKLQLLKSIDFYAEPGKLTALMGGSGAGKTTLMDVVCGRKTQGIIRGDIIVNGHPKQQDSWSRVVGYVEQMDIHSARITVKESLHFSARLRLDEQEINDEQVGRVVEQTLRIVELDSLADSVVGEAGGSGLSIEQRKRLSIAVELVANPSVLFMDEPTSGLDARAAAIVMRAVRNVADSNRTVVVTIHQPSMEIFEAFDQLVLLQRGGRLTYFGPLGFESSNLIAYLQSYHDVLHIRPGYNPATWMLEVTGGSMATTFKAASIDFPQAYADSQLKKENLARMDELVASSAVSQPPVSVARKYAASNATQARECMKKYIKYYWRAPNYNFVRIVITLCIALIYGLTYLNQGKPLNPGATAPTGIDTVQNIMGLMFSLSIFNGMFNCMIVMPLIASERVVFYREQASSMYAPRMISLGQGVAEMPYLLVQALAMVCITYWMVGFQPIAWKFFYFLLMFFLTITMYTFLGQALVIATPNMLIAQLFAAFLNQIWTITNGFLVPYPDTPKGYQWLSRISPTTWMLYGLGGSQLADSTVPFQPIAGGPPVGTVGEFVQNYFGYDPGFVWWCPLILFAYVAFFRALSGVMLSYVNYNKR